MADTLDLTTKIPRAIRALILMTGVGTPENTFAAESTEQQRAFPNTTIIANEGEEGDGGGYYLPGMYFFRNCQIIFRDEAVTQPNETTPAFNRANQRFSDVVGQLALSDDEHTEEYTRRRINAAAYDLAANDAENNGDLANFGLRYYHITSYGKPEKVTGDSVTYYERILTFECMASNAPLID